ncbi:uncharacterized protein LOC113648611 isoform X1 [Tachysurus fulvidraco]|uniref:uncharacterized protein LOC113648611 isoform X1 n=2 Tax=Tachysurus fulvidraco TaxID=1234273 RepID=UPI001FEF8C32|nr:uncharacterized protein LOC113648611 isoform X1 [Tachysurus fulvidraco]
MLCVSADMWIYMLLFGMQIFSTALTASGGSITVKLHHNVTLTCEQKCSGVLRWSRNRATVAQCNQMSCSSKEGFILSHDQFLKGNLSLTITAADYSRRGLYTCQCDEADLSHVRLLIQTQEMTCVIALGEPIDVPLPLTDQVEVRFTESNAAQPSDMQICTVDHEEIKCSSDYRARSSRLNTLQITDGRVSDTGSYTVRDQMNNETLAILRVQVREEQPGPDRRQECVMPVWLLVLVLVLVVSAFVVLLVMHVRLKREILQLRGEHNQLGMNGLHSTHQSRRSLYTTVSQSSSNENL